MKSQRVDCAEIKRSIVDNMRKEIYLMREVLSNMQMEEKALSLFDRCSLNHTLQERFSLVQKLKVLRQDTVIKIEMIQTAKSSDGGGKKLPIEKILPATEEDSCEITYLSDQLLALVEKTNRQFMHNEVLTEQYLLRQGPSPQTLKPLQDFKVQSQSSTVKTAIATYPPKQP